MSADVLLELIAGRDPDGLVEVRCRHPRKGAVVERDWFSRDEFSKCERYIQRHARRLDVYIGCAPRTRREGGKAAIQRSWCLWVDCDSPESVQRLHAFSPQPSLVISSGTGAHAYWSLSTSLSPAWTERANRRLAHALGADMRATDSTRILRPPDTLNHKHNPPAAVTIDWANMEPLSVASLKNFPDPPGFSPLKRRLRRDVRSDDPLMGISADHYYERLTGRPVTRGNVQCPFHGDGKERNPSMRLYDTTWYCFVCCAGGSVIQFGSHLYDMGTRGAEYWRLRERLTRELT